MEQIKKECSGCGYTLNENIEFCPYCGKANPYYVKKSDSLTVTQQQKNTSENNSAEKKSKFNAFIFILLLLICWPISIVYLIVTIK